MKQIRLLKSYLGYGAGTVGSVEERSGRSVLLLRGSAHTISTDMFIGMVGSTFEYTDEEPTEVKEPALDKDLNAPVDPEKDKPEPAPES